MSGFIARNVKKTYGFYFFKPYFASCNSCSWLNLSEWFFLLSIENCCTYTIYSRGEWQTMSSFTSWSTNQGKWWLFGCQIIYRLRIIIFVWLLLAMPSSKFVPNKPNLSDGCFLNSSKNSPEPKTDHECVKPKDTWSNAGLVDILKASLKLNCGN